MNSSYTIFTSTILSGIVAAIVSALVSFWLKKLDFKNEYYKKIIDKRLEAYKFLETQISVLKSSAIDDTDNKIYHLIFSYGKEKFHEFQNNLAFAMAYGLWINDDTMKLVEKLNELFFHISNDMNKHEGDDISFVGKKYYSQLVELRNNLELSVRDDLLHLYDFSKFSKKRTKSKRLIKLENPALIRT